MTKQDLFWRLFQSSGHVGAYLLYSWYQRDSSASESPTDENDTGQDHFGIESEPMGSVNLQEQEAASQSK